MTFIAAVAFFTYGAASNGLPASWRTAWELVWISLVVVFIVGLATNWRGCSTGWHVDFEEARGLPAISGGAV